MNAFNKLKWVLGITVVFVIILSTNLIDRNNFLRVKDSIETIYRDRLVADDLIFDMMRCIHDKEIALYKKDSLFFNSRNELATNELKNYLSQYEFTKLTEEENLIFGDLKIKLKALREGERLLDVSILEQRKAFEGKIAEVKEDLYDLSKIQLLEGKRESSSTQRVIETVELFTQLEIYLLIILAIIVQILIIYTPKSNVEKKE